MSKNIGADEVEFAIIKIVNDDNNILNNKNDKKNAKSIKNKLAYTDKNFEKVDLKNKITEQIEVVKKFMNLI